MHSGKYLKLFDYTKEAFGVPNFKAIRLKKAPKKFFSLISCGSYFFYSNSRTFSLIIKLPASTCTLAFLAEILFWNIREIGFEGSRSSPDRRPPSRHSPSGSRSSEI
jgi:hypothetical protein